MSPEEFNAARRWAALPHGRVAYMEKGSGPAAIFIHGVPLNGWHWRHVMAQMQDIRRCIAPDLLGLGHTEVAPGQSLKFEAQAQMILAFADSIGVDQFDLVGNDSGGAIAQIVATSAPQRIRSLTLTNCDTHDNWPPTAFLATFALAKAGHFANAAALMRGQLALARSPAGFGPAYQFKDSINPEMIGVYLDPVLATPENRKALNGYVAGMENSQTVRIHDKLKAFTAPTLIVWGDDDVFFPARWAKWLGDTIPGTKRVEILKGARLFFPEERADELCALLREHWTA